MTTWRSIGEDAAAEANKRLREQSLVNQTTAPMREMSGVLNEIKVLLIEIRNLLQDGKQS